jgi:hypothetical protein
VFPHCFSRRPNAPATAGLDAQHSKERAMKRALLAAALTLAAASGCGWQTQSMQGNHCVDSQAGCAACGTGHGRLRDHVGHGQLRDRLAAGAHSGPAHVQGDIISCLMAHKHQQNAPAAEGPVPTMTYPYYTVRGPRDYFLNDPMPLGY